MARMDSIIRKTLVIVLAVTAICGCGDGDAATALDQEQSALKTLGLAYVQYVRDHDGRVPASVEEFKTFFGQRYQRYLNDSQQSLDELFTSPRDNLPFAFVTDQTDLTDLVAYEQQGVDGVRRVCDSAGNVSDLDEESFQAAMNGGNP